MGAVEAFALVDSERMACREQERFPTASVACARIVACFVERQLAQPIRRCCLPLDRRQYTYVESRGEATSTARYRAACAQKVRQQPA